MAARRIERQILASTHEDLQGDRLPREVLESAVQPARMPLVPQHDPSQPAMGYVENLAVIPFPGDESHWALVGDLVLETGELDEALRGFSISATGDYVGDREAATIGIYLPFPLYRDNNLVDRFAAEHPNAVVGAYLQKAAQPEVVGLIVGFALFVLGPEWTRHYDLRVRPLLVEALDAISKFRTCDASANLSWPVSAGSLEFELRIIPERGDEPKCLDPELVETAFAAAKEFAEADADSNHKEIRTLVACLDTNGAQYRIVSALYADGTSKHAA